MNNKFISTITHYWNILELSFVTTLEWFFDQDEETSSATCKTSYKKGFSRGFNVGSIVNKY